MKERALCIVLLLVLSTVFVSAQTPSYSCSSYSDRLLSLSDTTNAHARYDATEIPEYPIDICFNDYFENTVSLPVTSHTCNQNNHFVGLSAITNAHGQVHDYAPAYPVDGCFYDLSCRTVIAPADCAANEALLFRLSSETNGHFETVEGTGNYQVKVCCSSVSGGTPTPICGNGNCETGESATCPVDCSAPPGGGITLRWEQPLGVPDQQAYLDEVVYARILGGTPSTTYALDIMERDTTPLTDDPVRTGLSIITDASGSGNYEWTITQSDFDVSDGTGEGDTREFYFIVDDGSTTYSGRNLGSGDDGILIGYEYTNPVNNPPTAIITSAEHRGIYYENTNIDFDQASTDDTGIVSYEWTIEKEGTVEDTIKTPTFTYNFPDDGERVITLKVTDGAGQSDEDQIAILVVGSPGIFAFINQPFHQETVPVTDGDGDGDLDYLITFSAEDSYVIESTVTTSCTGTVICLAGNCPATTENGPASCAQVPIPSVPVDFSAMNFDWNFQGAGTTSGLGDASGTVDYTASGRSAQLNDKKIDLTVSYDQGAISLSTSVEREFTLGQCLDNGRAFYDPAQGILYDTYADSHCAGIDTTIGTLDDCCAAGHECTVNGCQPVIGYNSCDDYTTQSSCRDDIYSVLEQDPLYDEFNCDSSTVDCSCAWSTTQSECGLRARNLSSGSVFPGGTACESWSCTYYPTAGECINGLMDITTTVDYFTGTCPNPPSAPQADCVSDTVTVPCGQFNIELGFFDYTQFILAVASIALIYSLHAWYNHRR